MLFGKIPYNNAFKNKELLYNVYKTFYCFCKVEVHEVVKELLNFETNKRVRIAVACPEDRKC